MGILIRRKAWLMALFLCAMLTAEGRGQVRGGVPDQSEGSVSGPAAQSRVVVVAEGDAAPDVSLTGLDGKTFRLSQWTDRGKNVVLIFSRAHW